MIDSYDLNDIFFKLRTIINISLKWIKSFLSLFTYDLISMNIERNAIIIYYGQKDISKDPHKSIQQIATQRHDRILPAR